MRSYMTLPKRFSLALLMLLFASPLACNDNDEASCEDLCSEAQAKDCTSITGDCGQFCAALFDVEGPSGCAGEREAYHECLNEGSVCVGCSGEESALETCLGNYCAANYGNSDCQTLVGSLN